MSERLKQSAFNMASSTAGFIVPMAVVFVTTPFLLHALGEAAYGIQALAGIIVGYFAIFDMGMDLPIIKFLAEDHAKKDIESANRLLSSTLSLYLLIGLLGAIITFAASGFLARAVFKVPENQVVAAIWVFRIAGIGFIFSLLMSWGRALAVGLQRLEISSGISGLATIIGASGGLIVVYAGFGVVGYVFTRVVITAVAGLIYIGAAKRLMPDLRIHFAFELNVARRLSSFIGYGVVYRATNAFFSRIDQVMLGAWISVAQAGIYALPSSIVPLVVQLIASMITLFLPLTSQLQGAKQVDYLRQIYIRYARFTAAATTMCFVPLMVFSDKFMYLWAGASVAQAARGVFLFLLAAGYIGTLATILLVNALIGLGRIKEFALFMLCRNLFLALVCLFLIPHLGLIGAGIAQFLTSAVDLGFMFYFLPRILAINGTGLMRSAYLKPVLLGLSIGAAMWVIKPAAISWFGLILCVGLFQISYVLAGFGMGIFADTEKRALQAIWQAVLGGIFIKQER